MKIGRECLIEPAKTDCFGQRRFLRYRVKQNDCYHFQYLRNMRVGETFLNSILDFTSSSSVGKLFLFSPTIIKAIMVIALLTACT